MKKSVKRLVILALMAVIGFGAAQAQFRFGIKAGMNINKLHISDWAANAQADNGCGFTGGLMTEFQVPLIGLCFDASLMYTRMNSDPEIYMNANDQMAAIPASMTKNFFEIPVNIKYKFGIPVIGNVFAPYLFTGPSFAFKLGGSDDVFKTKTFQCAWNIGLGIQLFNHLQVGASYGFGINNIMDKVVGINTTDDTKIKNNYWTVTAAWLF